MTLTLTIGFILPALLTTLGASLIFFCRKESEKWSRLANSLSAGIMFSASIFSLLLPAIESAQEKNEMSFLPISIGFVFGIFLIVFLDLVINLFHKKKKRKFSKIIKKCTKIPQKMPKKLNFLNFSRVFLQNSQNSSSRKSAMKLFWAITIHNIPEGLCVGLAIGSAAKLGTSLSAAMMLAVGIGLQNFPEGFATALPIKECVHSNKKAFFLAFLSGIVEPIFAVLGFFLSSSLSAVLPAVLSFSAGAMIFVVVEELMQKNSTWAFMLGFLFMMILDLAL